MKSIEEINAKIREGSVCVVTAKEMKEIVTEMGTKKAAKEVDVVTTGTFGAMCSTGVFINFGHADPPIKFKRVWLNDVEAYTGMAAVDIFLGATKISETREFYGGAHVIEELVFGKEVEMRAIGFGTDCYPRKEILTSISLQDVNQAVMVNPRNAYQRYRAATNSSERILRTYMGTLLPNYGNVTFAGTGEISPMNNDPEFRTIGIGTRIFLCGARGYIIGEGTQHSPPFGTLMVKGNLKEMKPDFLKACYFPGYAPSIFLGIGIPIPVLDDEIAKATGIKDDEIKTTIIDFGVPRRDRPTVREVSYAELKSGKVEINGQDVRVSPLSSYYIAEKVMKELKKMIEKGEFFLSMPVERVKRNEIFKPMKQREIRIVREFMTKAVTINEDLSIEDAAMLMIQKNVNHLPVVDKEKVLKGIVTSWDIAKAITVGARRVEEVMTRDVVTVFPDEPIAIAISKLEKYDISALPVIDNKKRVLGIVTSETISKMLGV
ncbi:MAG: homocysteine biosynthesis protein [Archaeoglobaceae archaeon]|nr:homocysteine biosynthesis protein [Archaeoglobaceae archaeon]MDW7989500.1 homocysteine biosynthesis protein [Archaeoglobaceae archaeon]